MTMHDLIRVIAVATAYIGLLFAVATWAERREGRGRRVAGTPLAYVLSLATYCTTWTFYGSVGFATRTGFLFLAVYLGPTLGAALWWHVLRKMVRIKSTHRVTSVVDLLSLRYGRSQLLGAIATVALLAAVVPYIALQLKTMIAAAALLAPQSGAPAMGKLVGPAFVVLMIVFTIVFGLRRLSPTERHPGMVAALASEGVVKLVAFVAVGAFVTYRLFDGLGDVFHRAADAGLLHGVLGQKGSVATWVAVLTVSALAVVFLPRQFHVAVVENSDEDHVRSAMWGFPLYMLAITAFTLPIAFGGLVLGHAAATADSFVLALPLAHGAPGLAWVVFLGGFSAGTAMIMCEAMTVATMVSNHLVLPVLDLFRPLAGLRRHVLTARWCAAALLIIVSFGYVDAFGAAYDLVSMGLVAHAGVLVIAPIILAGLYWRGASTAGALAGVVTGFATWTYTLVVPVFARAGWLPATLLTDGPAGISALRPEALLGISGLDGFPHAIVWILLVSGGAFLLGSLLFPASAEERARVERLVGAIEPARARSEREAARVMADAAQKQSRMVALFSEYHSREDARRMADACLERIGASSPGLLSPLQLASLQSEVETTLASFIGAAAAHAAMQRVALATPHEARAISRSYARLLAELNVPPAELHRTLDYHRERERLLAHEVEAQRFLAELRGRLAASLDLETTGRNVVELPVPRLAEAALLWVARPDAKGARAWIRDADPAGQDRTSAALAPVVPTLGTHPMIARAMESGRLVVSGSGLDPLAPWPGGLGDSPRFRETATFPLVAGGCSLGTLTLFASERHGFRFPEDTRLCEEFAHGAAIAIENATLLRMAQDAVHARDEFLAVASHELKTPLTPLRLRLQTVLRLLSRAGPPPSREELAASIRGTDAHLQRVVDLVDQLLDTSRLASEGPRLALEPTDLGALVGEVVERHRAELDQAGCDVSVSVTRPVVGSFDRIRIGQVVTNILMNAMKYAPGPIEVVVEMDAPMARLAVRDRGPGIAPQDSERIFRPFERTVSRLQASGFGLGLHIVRRIVEAHGGGVRVESALGAGSRFVVELPLAPTEANASGAQA
jgi:signal transduction histidine kinase/Na+/proline symporter